MIKKISFILMMALSLLSCSHDLKFENIFDPNCDPSLWAPGNLTITPIAYNQIKLTWTKSTYNVEGYKISRKVGTGTWQEDIATVNANVLEWIDTNAPYGTSYSYKVKAYAGTHVSQSIEQNQEFVLTAPTTLTITPQSATSIKLTWQDRNLFEQGFKISRKIANGTLAFTVAISSCHVPLAILRES
ncbi:MAG TPA: fibronectin type III domain-containing protein, partial [Candidatus Cloacimonadota bacterium]|nr:fibronectin type III domain-containing protein [Candidatus Cloacimonadota bacterium]